jgi:glycosyltransferase involved in cell wall biosynthesis
MLILAGKVVGIDLTPLKQCANVKVEDSRLTNEEYMFLLRRTDVYMLPYRKISQSGALFTAMTEHIPLLVSDAGGLSEPLDMANIGWKVKAGDKESLRQQLIYIANHNEDIAKIKDDSDSWERLCDAYGWTEISHKTSVLYNRF